MKTFIRNIVIAISSVIAVSCVAKMDPVFDESSAIRIQEQMEQLEEVLMSSPNGWIVEYYPATGLYFGGFNVLMNFTPGKTVTVASELSGVTTQSTSTYSLLQSSGCVLSFDTYNKVLHAFSDPESSAGYGAGYGYEGDFEFIVLEASEDVIRLKGRKTGNFMTMTPISPAVEWSDYLKSVKAQEQILKEYTRLKYVCGDMEVQARMNGRILTVKYEDEDGKYTDVSYPFVVTSQGLKFYQPVAVGNDVIEGLTFIPEMGDDAAFIPINDSEGMFVPAYPSLSEFVLDRNWFFSYSGMSPSNQLLWADVKALLDADNDDITYCHLGNVVNILGEFFAFVFLCKNAGSVRSYLAFDVKVEAADRISLQFAETGDYYGKEYYINYKFYYLLTPLGNEKKKTFTLTADDPRDPQWIKFQDENDPENYFTLKRSLVYYPMNN